MKIIHYSKLLKAVGLDVDDLSEEEKAWFEKQEDPKNVDGLAEFIELFAPKKRKMSKNPLFINKKKWSTFSDAEMQDYKDKVFAHYRKNGFPHFQLTAEQIENVWQKMIDFDVSKIKKENNILSQNMLGLNLVNYFMPHMWSTKCRGFKSPMETFENDEAFKKAIDKRISMGDNMSDAGMRKALSWSNGTHRVSNFRPTVAKYIYETYGGDGRVLDFSCGYGGRLAAALCSEKVKEYFGFEPCLKTRLRLQDLRRSYLNKYITTVDLYYKGFEEGVLYHDDYFDLAFSSPPYFNTEEYDYHENQSFIKFPTKEKWEEGFLKPLIKNNYNYLKSGGIFAINVANVKSFPDLEEVVVRESLAVGFSLQKTYKMTLSGLMKSGFKYEPIFIFKK